MGLRHEVRPVRRTVTLAGALFAVALVVGGCGSDDSSGGTSTDEQAGGSAPGGGTGVSCNGQEIAPPLAAESLAGTWAYQESWLYEDGEEYYADARGDLVISADGRWDGSREVVTGDGSFAYPVAYGPGSWTFDSRSLTLSYDDGSDAETYTGVRVSDQTTAEGAAIRALTLENADETGCTVLLLYGQP